MEDLDREIVEMAARLTALRALRRKHEISSGHWMRERTPRVQSIKAAYLANQVSVEEIARIFGTSRGYIHNLVTGYDWPRRSPPRSNRMRGK